MNDDYNKMIDDVIKEMSPTGDLNEVLAQLHKDMDGKGAAKNYATVLYNQIVNARLYEEQVVINKATGLRKINFDRMRNAVSFHGLVTISFTGFSLLLRDGDDPEWKISYDAQGDISEFASLLNEARKFLQKYEAEPSKKEVA